MARDHRTDGRGAFETLCFAEFLGCRLSVVGCRLSDVGSSEFLGVPRVPRSSSECWLSVVGCRFSVLGYRVPRDSGVKRASRSPLPALGGERDRVRGGTRDTCAYVLRVLAGVTSRGHIVRSTSPGASRARAVPSNPGATALCAEPRGTRGTPRNSGELRQPTTDNRQPRREDS
jgi:hypothetical protein